MAHLAKKATPPWRNVLRVHPAAEWFPLMNPDELRALGEDIKKNGLKVPIAYCKLKSSSLRPAEYLLVDGRHRLDAMALAGLEPRLNLLLGDCVLTARDDWEFASEIPDPQEIYQDPWSYVVSANIHRRHLTVEKKRELIADLLKATPERSDRQIAETVKASPTTVGNVRKELEQLGVVSNLDTRTDKRGRQQPSRKPMLVQAKAIAKGLAKKPEPEPEPPQATGNAVDPEASAAARKQEAATETELHDLIPDTHKATEWQRSLGTHAGDAIALRAHWTREFGDWEAFDAPSDLITLADEAARAWVDLARHLRCKQSPTERTKAAAPPADPLDIPAKLRRTQAAVIYQQRAPRGQNQPN